MDRKGYGIDDFYIVDQQTSQRYYIREILDACCTEYETSKLSAAQKLEIIDAIGLNRLTQVLATCFQHDNKSYDAQTEAAWAYRLLKKEVVVSDNELAKVDVQHKLFSTAVRLNIDQAQLV